MSTTINLENPHAVLVPFPAQGHVNPMLKLAKLLHNNGFHITFVNTEYNHRRLLKSQGPDSLTGLPSFKFETIPDGLPPSDNGDVTQDVPSLCESTSTTCLPHFKKLLARLNDAVSCNAPPVSCVITDGLMNFTIDAAEEMGIPQVMFQTTSACGFLAYAKFEKIAEMGYVPFKDPNYLTNGDLDTVLEGIPGLIKGMRLRDIPTFIRTQSMLNFFIAEINRAKRASAIILNTFEPLEQTSLDQISSSFPPIYAIGPLNLIEEKTRVHDTGLDKLGSNLWKNDLNCLEWLDTKAPDSVILVNFGSITVMTPGQLTEFAWGLANSNQHFLWIVRPDLVSSEKSILPPEFLEAIEGRGMLARWCSQEEVLNHASVGGFLTHSGWNSTLESICSGVPMICWPFFAEQQTNCWYSCTQWGVGMEIGRDVERDDVAGLVRSLMVGERGKEMKKRAMEWKKLAHESAEGSSYRNLETFIGQLKRG